MCQSREENNAPTVSLDMENIARIVNEEALERRAELMEHMNQIAIVQRQLREAIERNNQRREQLVRENEEAPRRLRRQNEEAARRLFGQIMENAIFQNANNLPEQPREENVEQVAHPVEQNNDNANQEEGEEENNRPDIV